MDTENLLRLLNENKAAYIVIGATAFPIYGYARATLDIDIFVKPTLENIKRVKTALEEFGYDLADISYEDLLNHKLLIRQYVVVTDIHPFVTGVSFEELWEVKVKSKFGETEVYFPSLESMIKMKEAAGRPKDIEDLKYLKKIREQESAKTVPNPNGPEN
ncbi:MAG: nucleotidyltransferase family protein [bacterium]|nr:nucleotidyltransferase family protein [bacterium]